MLIRNATILTGTGRTLTNHSILVRNGKIVAIGAQLEAEPGTAEIDASGRFVMPGIIDTHSHIKITQGVNESTLSIVPEVRVKDVINTEDVSEFRALAGGVTAARLLHGSASNRSAKPRRFLLQAYAAVDAWPLADLAGDLQVALGDAPEPTTRQFLTAWVPADPDARVPTRAPPLF